MKKTPQNNACPICGEINQCEIDAGSDRCWCFDFDFSLPLKKKLENDYKGLACICKNCAKKESIENENK